MSPSYRIALLFVTSGLSIQAVVTQDSPNDIMGLMSFNWEEILTCKPNCIWLKTILVLLLANWLGWAGWEGLVGSMLSLWKYPKCPRNGDEEMEQKRKRRQGQVKKYSTCSDSVLRETVKGEGGKAWDDQDWRLRTNPIQLFVSPPKLLKTHTVIMWKAHL